MEYVLLKSAVHQPIVHTSIFGPMRPALLKQLQGLDQDLECARQFRNGEYYRTTVKIFQLLDMFMDHGYMLVSVSSSQQEISRYKYHAVSVVTLYRPIDPRCLELRKQAAQVEEPASDKAEVIKAEVGTDNAALRAPPEPLVGVAGPKTRAREHEAKRGHLADKKTKPVIKKDKGKKNVSFSNRVKVVDI